MLESGFKPASNCTPMSPRRPILRATSLIFVVVATAIFSSHPSSAAERPPNFIFILTDDQGWFETGIHGNPHIETPAMDQLAREGVRFTHFYAMPVCSPTRSGLMTGRYAQRTGAIDTFMGHDTMAASEITIASLLQQRGYRTGIFGKWHLGRYARYHPNQRGFDEFFGFWQYGFINHYFDADELFHNHEPVVTTGYITDVLTDAAISFLKTNRDRPFFLYLPYNAPHDPHLVDDKYIDMYLQRGVPLKDARIYGMVTVIDQNLRRLLKTLDEQGLRENTVVIFMSDNGGVSQFFKAGLRGNKGSVFEGGTRVPFFVRWPNHFPAGAVVDALAEYVDVFPTLAELAGVNIPVDRKIDGRSLVPLLKNGSGPSPHEFIFRQWTRVRPKPDENWAVRDAQFKLVNGELFDLQNDPGEKKNIAGQNPDIVRHLRSEFEKWFADVTAGQTYERVPIEVGRADENPVEIDVTWAEAVGAKIKPTYRRYIRDAIENWSEAADSVRWKIDVVASGRYEVLMSYGCRPTDGSSTFRISAGGSRLDGTVEAGVGADVFVERVIGEIKLPKGPATFEIKPLSLKGKELMSLHKIWLKKLP